MKKDQGKHYYRSPLETCQYQYRLFQSHIHAKWENTFSSQVAQPFSNSVSSCSQVHFHACWRIVHAKKDKGNYYFHTGPLCHSSVAISNFLVTRKRSPYSSMGWYVKNFLLLTGFLLFNFDWIYLEVLWWVFFFLLLCKSVLLEIYSRAARHRGGNVD